MERRHQGNNSIHSPGSYQAYGNIEHRERRNASFHRQETTIYPGIEQQRQSLDYSHGHCRIITELENIHKAHARMSIVQFALLAFQFFILTILILCTIKVYTSQHQLLAEMKTSQQFHNNQELNEGTRRLENMKASQKDAFTQMETRLKDHNETKMKDLMNTATQNYARIAEKVTDQIRLLEKEIYHEKAPKKQQL